jgi:hypothetical protein
VRAAPIAAALPFALAAGCGAGAPAAGDPGPLAIVWATYLGGSALEEIREPRVRPDGALLVGARTLSPDMPVTPGAFQPRYGGGQGDTWLGVLSPADGRLLAASYFGGSGMERPAYGLALHPSGDVVFASGTTSPDLPTSEGAFRPRPEPATPEPGGGYVARISGDLAALRWCTYTAGLWPRGGLALAADGGPIVVGTVGDPGFPATPDALQSEARGRDDVGILHLDADGRRALTATRLGGSGSAEGEVALSIAVAPGGDWVIAGIATSADFPTRPGAAQPGPGRPLDAFVARIGGGSRLVASTLFGGSGDDGAEHPHALLADGSVLIAGTTSSPDFPTTEGAFQREARGSVDGFLAKLDPDGARVAFATRLGGSGQEHLLGPVPAPDGSIWIGGATSSRDFPTTADALQTGFAGGPRDAVLLRVSGDGSRILYATYLGGSDDELVRGIALGPAGEIYAVGKTLSEDFPTTPGALQRRRAGAEDGFVVKLAPRSPGP